MDPCRPSVVYMYYWMLTQVKFKFLMSQITY